jgi:hypothetical protein
MIHILPQCPFKNRYTEDWIDVWEREMSNLNIDYKIIGGKTPIESIGLFSNFKVAMNYELDQYKQLLKEKDIEEILFLDIDFPGFNPSLVHLLKHINPDLKAYGYVHAGSWCNKDIFYNEKGKKELELSTFKLFDKLFVATEYHRNKICNFFERNFVNMEVVGLPFYRQDVLNKVDRVKGWDEKKYIFFSGRKEQSDMENWRDTLKFIEKWSDFEVKTYDDIRTRKEYFDMLNNSKISISFKIEETFGLSQLEAYSLKCVPLSPNHYSYKEIFPKKYLYYTQNNIQLFFQNNIQEFQILKEDEIDFEKYENSISKIFNLIEENKKCLSYIQVV